MQELNREEIEKVLNEKVRPDMALHGGNIRVEKLEDRILYVRMTGQCSGCPSADLTMENIVNTELKEAFPELEQVVLVTGVSDGLISQARELLNRRHCDS
ncbi:MAG: NifU family protein [Eubacterium sp.]|jgi:Thioredoxin-like proteins and domains|nr:NifU family protein [Eubacterium sp.]